MNRSQEEYASNESLAEGHKHSSANEKRESLTANRSARAHELSDTGSARQRKELYDAIDESEAHMKQHERVLKEEFVAANRADILRGVQEKQHHLS
ncbi:hypothetical protein HDV03_001854 [Kappamyces sp. JEL0829]|nr:hypothetical protein HDV03_001854 [Kappamyces sp. JEL0829]